MNVVEVLQAVVRSAEIQEEAIGAYVIVGMLYRLMVVHVGVSIVCLLFLF